MHYERVNYLQDTCNYLHIFVRPYTGKSILDLNNNFLPFYISDQTYSSISILITFMTYFPYL